MVELPPPLIHISRDGQPLGPYPLPQVWTFLQAGRLVPNDLARDDAGGNWQPLGILLNLPPGAYSQDIGQNAGMRMLLPVGRSGWAIAAGYLGLFSLIVLPAPLALIVSLVAIFDLRRRRNDPSPPHGMGRAIFGLIMGIVGTALIVMFLVSANKR